LKNSAYVHFTLFFGKRKRPLWKYPIFGIDIKYGFGVLYIYMQEELKQNYVLLSKVAKEKKYAQEYLGLLARRGDIGSIRIGKRWFTTWQWFEEFLECSQKKKAESVVGFQEIELKEIASEKAAVPIVEKMESVVPIRFAMPKKERIEASISLPVPEKVAVVANRENISTIKPFVQASAAGGGDSSEIKLRVSQFQKPEISRVDAEKRGFVPTSSVPVSKRMASRIPLRRMSGDAAARFALFPKEEQKAKNVPSRKMSIEERNKQAVPYPEMKLKRNASVFSPALAEMEEAPLVSRFGLSFSFALMLFLVAVSGYFIYSGGLLKNGTVAGAVDEKNGGFLEIKSGSEYFALNASDKMKESLSISRVVIEAVREKASEEKDNNQKSN
jgi:hypothetical protein